MKILEVLRLSGSWHGDFEVQGYGHHRGVTFDLEEGEWMAVVGRNGIGKSTLLHALAGSLPFVVGRIEVDGEVLPKRDPTARFFAGLLHVPQHSHFQGEEGYELPFTDALDLALASRPGLNNEVVINDSLLPQLQSLRWISGINKAIRPRLFDLVTAVLSVPRVLLLDEIATVFPADAQESYKELKSLLPGTCVVFVDHNLKRALSIADLVLWLREDARPIAFDLKDTKWRSKLLQLHGEHGTPEENVEGGLADWLPIIRLEESPVDQLHLAWYASSQMSKRDPSVLVSAIEDFPFLNSKKPAEHLSGGQRIVLLWFLLELTGLGRLPTELLGHLDPGNSAKLEEWRRLRVAEKSKAKRGI